MPYRLQHMHKVAERFVEGRKSNKKRLKYATAVTVNNLLFWLGRLAAYCDIYER